MKPSIQTLGQILYSPSNYVIPVFQRHYRWERPQWEKLWESLGEIQAADKKGNHFMGFLVFVAGLPQPGENTSYHLIDGQQRLTTASIVLAAIRNVARDVGDVDLAEEIHHDYLVHPRKKGDQHLRLLPKERDHDSYRALITGEGEATGRIGDAASFFEDRLSELLEESPDALRHTFNAVQQRLEFMCATLEAENAYHIFKSLNSTGVPLGPADLIRNFVFMHVPPDDHDEFDRVLWRRVEAPFVVDDRSIDEKQFSDFFRIYLMAEGRYLKAISTFDAFEQRFEATDFSPHALAEVLVESVNRYTVIRGDRADIDPAVTAALAQLNAFESTTTYPLLLRLFDRRARGVIDSPQLARCIEMLTGFVVRRFVCGESSRGYGRMFATALAGDESDTVAALEQYLLDYVWPDDRRFIDAFASYRLYSSTYSHAILAALECSRGHKERPDLGGMQVEHIMPQTLNAAWMTALGAEAERIHAEWLHRPGNLTLSGYNPELLNHPFERKRERYAQSNIGLTRDLAAYESWGEAQMGERGHALAEEAARIWVGPKEPFNRRKPVKASRGNQSPDSRHAVQERFWTGLSECLAERYPNLPSVDPRGTSYIALPSGIRYVRLGLWLTVRDGQCGVTLTFQRESMWPLADSIEAMPARWNALVDRPWLFGRIKPSGRRWMSVSFDVEMEDDSKWSDAYKWLGETLTAMYGQVVPMVRAELEQDSENAAG